MLFFGLRLLDASLLLSFPFTTVKAGLPSPKTGKPGVKEAVVASLLNTDPLSLPGLLGTSSEMLGGMPDHVLLAEVTRKRACGGARFATIAVKLHLTPIVVGPTVVASGLLLGRGISDGCGGGVASWISSR